MTMDKNQEDNAPDLDNENEADQAMEDCLRNPVIVRQILEQFSSKELLQISLVNKLWKYEARSVLSQRGNLTANLWSEQRPGDGCNAVAAFISDLPKLGAAPFSGIKFDISYGQDGPHFCFPREEDLVRINDVNLLDQLSFTNVSVKIVQTWPSIRNCPGFLLAKKVLQQFCEDLEELELSVTVGQGHYIKQVVKDCNFPHLKVLKVVCAANDDIRRYMRALLSRAPNLKMLLTNWNINSVLRLLEGTSVEFVYTTTVRAPFNEVPDNAINATRFETMELKYTGRGFNFQRFNRLAPILLQASRTTIRHMIIDAVLAMPLMFYGIRLENVRILWLDIGRTQSIEPRILSTIKNFDFFRIFPNLDKVCVLSNIQYSHGPFAEHCNVLIERANAVLTEPLQNRAARIKKLSLPNWHPSSVAAQFLVNMFPNIEKLTLQITDGARVPISFASIWNWLDLNEVEVRGDLLPNAGNLDTVFCGIFPEEVEELRLKEEEYLKQVNIVPVRPAVTCLRNLRSIDLHHRHYSNEPYMDDDATFIFSKVTALIAFARQPGLVVKLRISARAAPPAMTHLEPYVSVSVDRL